MKKPLVHNNWDPLEEIWLGDVWPTHFYDDLEPRIRDSFYQITEWTKEDLAIVQRKLEELGVKVLRPRVDGPKESYMINISRDSNVRALAKPPITPRDANGVVGDRLFFGDMLMNQCYKHLLDEYDPAHVFRAGTDDVPWVSGANTVKLGRDIIFDYFLDVPHNNPGRGIDTKTRIFQLYERFMKQENAFFGENHRLHIATQGGHCDGCFMPLREGLLLASTYYKDYEVMFPEWETINLSSPTYRGKQGNGNRNANKWFLPGIKTPGHLNKYLEEFCPDWIGNFTETFFEVNIVMIDEKNMLCMGTHDSLFNKLEKQGITCHVVPFRTRTFWDGGLHCITLDTKRRSELKDYYPHRGSYGVKNIVAKEFNFSTAQFLEEYEKYSAAKI